jgi:sodium/hydrogen exchanger-like protein 6/7
LGKLRNENWDLVVITKASISFFAVFTGSLLVGIIIGLLCAMMLKYTSLEEFPSLETCLIVILAYGSYMLSNAMQFSGIVSLLFCGITMKHYASDNMSQTTRETTKNMFQVLSQLSENFIFIYLGVALFTKTQQTFLIGFILLALVKPF